MAIPTNPVKSSPSPADKELAKSFSNIPAPSDIHANRRGVTDDLVRQVLSSRNIGTVIDPGVVRNENLVIIDQLNKGRDLNKEVPRDVLIRATRSALVEGKINKENAKFFAQYLLSAFRDIKNEKEADRRKFEMENILGQSDELNRKLNKKLDEQEQDVKQMKEILYHKIYGEPTFGLSRGLGNSSNDLLVMTEELAKLPRVKAELAAEGLRGDALLSAATKKMFKGTVKDLRRFASLTIKAGDEDPVIYQKTRPVSQNSEPVLTGEEDLGFDEQADIETLEPDSDEESVDEILSNSDSDNLSLSSPSASPFAESPRGAESAASPAAAAVSDDAESPRGTEAAAAAATPDDSEWFARIYAHLETVIPNKEKLLEAVTMLSQEPCKALARIAMDSYYTVGEDRCVLSGAGNPDIALTCTITKTGEHIISIKQKLVLIVPSEDARTLSEAGTRELSATYSLERGGSFRITIANE